VVDNEMQRRSSVW